MSKEEITKLHAEIDINHINSIRADSFSARILRVAEYYCSIGLYVIPLAKKSKSLPEAKMGINYDSASNKLATIRRWFGVGGKFEGHNIGLACGRSDGIMALDIDLKMKHGTNGSLELERLIEEGNVLPTAPIQITPSGGKHYIFRWKEGCSSSSDKIAVGIDTRGGMEDRFTGHIVAFPSFTDQGTYS